MTLKQPKVMFLLGFITGNLFLFAVIVVAALVVVRSYMKSPEEIAEGLKVPPIPSALEADYNLPLKTLTGDWFDFATLRGRPAFVTFFNPDCKSCQGELGAIEQLYQVTQDEVGFALVARSGSVDEIQQVIGRFNLTAPVYLLDGERPPVFNIPSVPATFILSADGRIAFRHTGTAKWNDEVVIKFLHDLAAAPAGNPTEK